MTRARLLLLVVLPTLLIGLGVGALLLIGEMDRREQVRTADAAAAEYAQQMEVFREGLAQDVGPEALADPVGVGDVVAEAAEDLPELEPVSEYGEASSSTYQSARDARGQTQEALEEVQQTVERGIEAERFADAAEGALAVDPNSFVTEQTLPNGSPVRERVIPPLRSTLAEVESLETPEGAQEARRAVVDALQFVIDEATTLAAELDAGRSYQFEFGTRYGEAGAAVTAYRGQALGDLREAFDRLVGEPAASV
ncbi:hypothetical protein ACHAAC_16940 [Aeromicrobium sp. CF4.19]|uniref:hypothetical protein n=1 Tax=Aeromicrobium sp. CF4.19 TaxID=3373082 RepID=UPI003EE54B14